MTKTRRRPPTAKARGPRPLRPIRVEADGRLVGPEFLTQAELAHLLGVRRETIWAMERRGLLSGVSIGSMKRYPRPVVQRLLRSKDSAA